MQARDVDRKQLWLAMRVSEELGREPPYTQARISQWLTAKDPPPEPRVVFAIERALGMEPGSSSRLLGYVPEGTAPATSVVDAINADPALGPIERRSLLAMYRTLADGSEGRVADPSEDASEGAE